MRRQLRHLALFTCITAATAFGGHLALADTGSSPDRIEMKRGEQQRKGHRARHHLMKMAKELGLTEQQKTQAKALYDTHRAENGETLKEMRAQKQQLRKLVHSGSADEAAIRAQAAKVAEAEADLAVAKAQMARKFQALLTPEQVNKYREMAAKHEGRMKRFGCCGEAEEK